jgi:hypothetical protein
VTTHVQKVSRKQERRAARDVGGDVQHNSGALPQGGGGDVRVLGKIRLECKYTQKDTYVLKLETLERLVIQARRGGLETPVLQVGFRDTMGRIENYAVVRKGDYESWGGPLLPRRENCVLAKQYPLAMSELTDLQGRGVLLALAWVDVKQKEPTRTWVVLPWATYMKLTQET